MRICFVVSQIFAWGKYGGFGSMVRLLATELIKKGLDVCAVVPKRTGQKPVENLDGITVYSYPPALFFLSQKPFKFCDADIYHSQEPSFSTYLAMNAWPDRKHIITCQDPRDRHDWSVFYKYWTRSKRLTFPLSYLYENNYFTNQCVKKADAVFCQAKFITSKAKMIYGLDVEPDFLPNPVSIPSQGFEKAQEPTVCFIGRLDTIKRPQIFCELAKVFPDVKFILAGKSHDRRYDRFLRETYAKVPNLEMLGFIDKFSDPEGFSRILHKSWVMINTSVRECLPVSYLEAAAHKCAILSGTEKDPDDFAKNFGSYVGNDDYASGLESLLNDNRWKSQGEKGYDYVKQTHALDKVIDEHVALYENLLQKK